ncbi:unnamed protein product, partial [Mesorhabditis spiculigera]
EILRLPYPKKLDEPWQRITLGMSCQTSGGNLLKVQATVGTSYYLNDVTTAPRRHYTRPYIEAALADSDLKLKLLQRSVHFFLLCETPNSFQVVGKSSTVQETDPLALNKRILLPKATLDEAMEVAGGLATFVSLYALAVDAHARGIGHPETQLLALRLLLVYSRRWSSQTCEEIPRIKDLLSRILFAGAFCSPKPGDTQLPTAFPEDEELDTDPNSRNPETISEIFLQYCFRWDADGEKTSIILEPELLLALVERPLLWVGEHKIRFWLELVDGIRESLYDPQFSEFNLVQWKYVDLLHRLLLALHELSALTLCCYQCAALFSEGVTRIVPYITDILIGDQAHNVAIESLWIFILHSHPPEKTFIKNTITSYHDWLRADLPSASEEFPYPVYSTELCETLNKYYDEFCTASENRIQNLWENEIDIVQLRKMYDVGNPRSRDENEPASPSFTPRNRQERPPEQPSVNYLRAALIEQLVSVLRCGPDQLIYGLLHDTIGWQSIIVLLNRQRNQAVQAAVMRLVECFLQRSPDFTKAMFIKFCGGPLLANQLRGHEMSERIADAAFGMMIGEPVLISHGLDGELLARLEVNQLNCESTYIVLAVLAGSTHDISVFARVSNSVAKVFEYNSQLQAAFIDNGIVDVLVECLRKIALSHDHDPEYRYGMRDIWKTLAQKVLDAGILYSDERVYIGCRQLIVLITLLDQQFGADWRRLRMEDPDSLATWEAHQAFIEVRRCLCTVLNEWIQRFWSLKKDTMKSASAPSSVESLNDDWSVVDGDLVSGQRNSEGDTGQTVIVDDYSVSPSRAILLDGTSPTAAYAGGQFAEFKQRMTKLGIVAKNILKPRYKRREKPAGLAHPHRISERMIFGLDMCLAVFSYFETMDTETREEAVLLRNYLTLLITAFSAEGSMREMWKSCTSQANSRARKALSQLAAFVIYPSLEYRNRWLDQGLGPEREAEKWMFRKRAIILSALVKDLSGDAKPQLRGLLRASMDDTYTMCLGIIDLALLSEGASESTLRDCSDIQSAIKDLNEDSPFDFFKDSRGEALKNFADNEKLAAFNYENERGKLMNVLKLEADAIKNVDAEISAALAMVAMKLTTEVVEQTTASRKSLVEAPRELIRNLHTAEDLLLHFEGRLFHPLAPLHNPQNWPNGFQLDTIEGPNRERRRLVPADYEVQDQYFRVAPAGRALRPNFEAILASGSFRRRRDELTVIDSYKYHCDVVEVRGYAECEGDLVVAEQHVHLLPRKTRTTHKQLPLAHGEGFRIPYTQITEIWERKYLLRDIAFEIFVKDGPARLIVFENTKVRSTFQEWLAQIGFGHVFPDPKKTLQIATEQWRHGVLNNFGYLMLLNKIAGRTYNDLMQYPVFPFVLSQYTMASLDLANPSNYRNFTRPMAIQDRTKENYYAQQYAQLEEADLGETLQHGPYHYGSHYSNSGIVSHFLVRLMPFTKMALEYQDGRFDLPDRLFNSIESVWRLSSSESTTDFKELIPEFFYFPEFLQNRHNLNLGVRQSYEEVNDVMLPPWVPSNAFRLFTLINRQALESAYVVANLHHWIDLIFGFKQNGKAAKEAMNVFHPLTHMANIAQADMGDEVDRGARATIIRTYGQMPTQLFNAPHQPHLTPSEQKGEKINGIPCASVDNIRWGEYVGSPVLGQCVAFWKHRATRDRISCLSLLPDNIVVGCGSNMIVATTTARDLKAATVVGIFCLPTPSSGLIRFRIHLIDKHIQPQQAWINAIDVGARTVTAMAYSNFGLLFLGFASGVISVYNVRFDDEGLHEMSLRGQLLAHSNAIHTIFVCDEFSSIITGCSAGRVVLWDRNGLSFVRCLTQPGPPLSAMTMSRVSGDIAIVTPTQEGSRVQLLSINGDIIGTAELDCIVTSITISELPEGTAVNALLCGCSDGIIRVIDLWGVREFGKISNPAENLGSAGDPVIATVFSANHRRLFVARQSGNVVAMRSERDNALSKTVSFMHITAYRDPL